jgi:hypothetical protein
VIRILALAIAIAAPAEGRAEPAVVMDGSTGWRLDLPDGFVADPPEELGEGTLLASFTGPAGRRVRVARLRGHTDPARAGERSFLAGVEEAVRASTPGYRRLSRGVARKLGRTGRIPAHDLWWRAGDAVRGARFVWLRGYALVVTVEAPRSRRIDPRLRRVLEDFQPR